MDRSQAPGDGTRWPIRQLFWALPLVVTGLAALHQLWLYAVLRSVAPRWHPWAQLAVYGATGVAVAWAGLRRIADAVEHRERAEQDLRQAYDDLRATHRQMLALHELGRQVADAADVQEVLTLAARLPVEVLDARATAVVCFDAEHDRASLEVAWGLPDVATARLRRVVELGLATEACRSCQALTANVNQSCPLLDPLKGLAPQEDIGPVICLPLSHGASRIGVIATYLRAGESPTPERTRMLSLLATELAPALEGARLRARLVAVLNTAMLESQPPEDVKGLLGRALSITLDGWEADAGAALLVTGEPQAWQVVAEREMGDMTSPRVELVLHLARLARERGHPVILPHARGRHGLRSVAVLPLETKGEVTAVLALASFTDSHFTRHQATILEALANQLALALNNAHLYHRLREMAVLEERYRISREMHDGLAQTLGYLGLQADRVQRLFTQGDHVQAASELASLRQVVREAYRDVRDAIDGLRVSTEAQGGLPAALRQLASDFAARSGLVVSTDAPESGDHAVSPEVELQLLRIVQEALTNVRRHARASHVEVSCRIEEGWADVSVSDDGQGFDPAASMGGRHLGMATMRERARLAGGHLTIATGPGRGTRILIRVPARTAVSRTG